MRRSDREITDPRRIEGILASARYLHLGMLDGQFPYVVPMHYGYVLRGGALSLYLHCAGEGHKLDCLRKDPHVFVEIDRGESLIPADTPCGYGAEYESIMGRGRAVILEDTEEKRRALGILMKTQTGRAHEISEAMARGVTVVRVDMESYTAKARIR